MESRKLVKIDNSARKHGLKDSEIRYAVHHPFGYENTQGNPEEKTIAFVGPRHEGGSRHNAIEVIVAMRADGFPHAFHAMPVTDRWMHLLQNRR
ncbi:MAG: hypothetical protein M3Z49_06405 [Bifidobacteriales bacterium]|nr:hypothetical protein [Bifidobacteriales bacterium]MCT6918825.1 hypothetical protein [Bifidobacteriales bacterium]